jgi:predicted MFS family arabinose efflux permease
MFGSSFAQVVGMFTGLSAADRLPPRQATAGVAVLFAAGTAVMAIPGLPAWGVVLAVLGIGLVNSVAGGVRWGLLHEILPAGRYLLGRSAFTIAVGAMQVAGFAAGGLLLTALSPGRAMLVAAGLHLFAAVVARFGLTARPPRAAGRPSIRATWQVNGRLWAVPAQRVTYLAMWVPNSLIVGCEALFVPYAPASAGALFMATAIGMLTGDVLVGRFLPPRWRSRLIIPLQLLLACPFLLFALPLPPGVALAAAGLAALGFSAGLLLQERLLAGTGDGERLRAGTGDGERQHAGIGDDVRGQALGLHSAGLLTMQAVGAALAGAVAELVPVGTAMTVMAVLSLCATAALTAAGRRATRDRALAG